MIAVKTIIGHHRVKLTNDRGNREDWAQIAVYLTPSSERKEKAEDIIKNLNKFIKQEGSFGFVKIFFDKKVMGPDPGKGVEVKLAGNKLENIEKAVNELKQYILSLTDCLTMMIIKKPFILLLSIKYNIIII